ncbi:hypothetical protein IQ13_0971 [Lacibacter cauensis]|uniref:Uncharacterized protein n=2 Tax=Lacibacter cauensis TaxID=510947 RepID=A0A562SX31_9BACT|nr:hypothetical protein IQ13_0971 [Lacibacter cauensis]
MYIRHCCTLFILLLSSAVCFGKNVLKNNDQGLAVVQSWFNAWETISKDICEADRPANVDFVFFDDSLVYSTSTVTISKQTGFKGPGFKNQHLIWFVEPHHDVILLPDGQQIKPSIMAFASTVDSGSEQTYFVMPLPSFWKNAGVESKELGIDNLLVGIFLHEYSHSQQIRIYGEQLALMEDKKSHLYPITDNIVQDVFESDSAYCKAFTIEVDRFYQAALSNSPGERDEKLQTALIVFTDRHNRWFVNNFTFLKEADKLFLTMEGLGQYMMYRWLIHKQGANLPEDLALKGVRRGGKKRSQEQGVALFLILEKKMKGKEWMSKFYGNRMEDIISVLQKEAR